MDFAVVRNRITTFPTLGRIEIAALASQGGTIGEGVHRDFTHADLEPPVRGFCDCIDQHSRVRQPPVDQRSRFLERGCVVDAGMRR